MRIGYQRGPKLGGQWPGDLALKATPISSGSFLLPDALATFTFVQAHMIPGSRIKKAENQAQLL